MEDAAQQTKLQTMDKGLSKESEPPTLRLRRRLLLLRYSGNITVGVTPPEL